MNDQDRDLILAFASGQLSEADAEAAAARIASDPELATELETQQLAIASLSAVPAVAMTSSERELLRSNLVSQLNLEPAPVPVAPVKRRQWWKPVAGFAAAAAVIAAVVILPGNLGGDDAADVALVAPDTAAVEEETFTSEDGSGGEGGAPNEVTTTAAASEAAPSADSAEPRDFRSGDVLDATEGADTPAEAEDSLDVAQLKMAPLDPARASDVDSCLEQLSDDLPQGDIIPLGTKDLDGIETLFLGITDETGITAVALIDLEACQIVELAR